ncbi:M48 family metalloprotease, partial [Desulfonauticus submarinus]
IFGAILSALTGVNMTETGADIGQLAFSQEFEAEADYVGCYCAARAGYNVSKAAQLWRRIAATHPSAINLKGTTHPSTAKRFIAIQKTVEEIKQKIENKQPLIPEGESHYNN